MDRLHTTVNFLNIRAIVLHSSIALLLFSTLFFSHSGFVEAHIVPKWYGFIAGTVLLTLAYSSSFARQRIAISLNYIDIAVSIFLGYLLARMLLVETPATTILSLTSFILLYFLFRAIPKDEIRYFNIIVVCLCVVQALYGIGQWTGLFSATAGFRMTGNFNNPAGFAACLAAGLPFCFSLTALDRLKILKFVGCICIGIIAVAVILCGSRSGIISITIVSLAHVGNRYQTVIRRHFKVFIVTAILFAIIATTGLLFLKKDSALGRVAIWHNSAEMIADKPFFGHGPGSFGSDYMLYQADYFAMNPDSRYAQLANNVTHPFNEYLLLVIEYGVLGLLLLIFGIVVTIRSERKLSASILCLLSIAVFACFSYPLRYPFAWVLIAYSLANLSKRSEKESLKITPRLLIIRSFPLFATAAMSVFLIKDIRFEYEWGRLARRGAFVNKDELIESYDSLHNRWNGDPLFLYNYGAVLNRSGRYIESNSIMSECEKQLNDYDVQMLLGDNSFQIDEWEDAKHRYLLAHNMIPNRFMPLFCLMELYHRIEDQEQALKIAGEIITKEVKIPSATIQKIIKKAQEITDETTGR